MGDQVSWTALPAASQRSELIDLRIRHLGVGLGKIRFRTGQGPLGIEHDKEIGATFA